MLKSTQYTAFNSQVQAMMDTCLSLADASIQGIKQAAMIQCDAVRSFMQESAVAAKNICSATNPTEAISCMQKFAISSVESSVAKSQELYSVLNQSQAVFSTAANSTIKGAQESLVKSVDQFSAVNPTFSKAASESIQNIITTTNQAADTVTKVTSQVAEVASKNLQAATQATLNTVKKAADTAAAK